MVGQGQKLRPVTNGREHNPKLSGSPGLAQSNGEAAGKSVSMVVAGSKGSHEIVSQLLQFDGVAAYPIIDVLNNPAHIAFRPPLSFLKETRAVSHENTEIVPAGRGNG